MATPPYVPIYDDNGVYLGEVETNGRELTEENRRDARTLFETFTRDREESVQ